MKDVAVFPIRHHSPRASAALARYLDRVQPELVLVDGPRDATRLIPYLFDADAIRTAHDRLLETPDGRLAVA